MFANAIVDKSVHAHVRVVWLCFDSTLSLLLDLQFYLVSVSLFLTENDPTQQSLCSTMENTIQQKKTVEEDEARADLWRRSHLLREAEKASKEAALIMKRKQVVRACPERYE